jgi:molybdate transport system ATP-binding protein
VTGIVARIEAQVGSLQLDIDLEAPGGTLAVVGPNGAGKTTLLSLLLGARSARRGRIEVGGAVLLDTERGIHVPVERRRLGYVPQDYALFPHLTAWQNVEFAIRSASPGLDSASRVAKTDRALADLALGALAERRPASLSGGEKQRLALARALSVEPRALLFDEPLSALDVHARAEVRSFLGRYLRSLALPSLVVTHDARDARALADQFAVLEAGRIVQRGTWAELSARPISRFVEQFVASLGAAAEPC